MTYPLNSSPFYTKSERLGISLRSSGLVMALDLEEKSFSVRQPSQKIVRYLLTKTDLGPDNSEGAHYHSIGVIPRSHSITTALLFL